VLSYSLFGLIFGGSVPHYFFAAIQKIIENCTPENFEYKRFAEFVMERLTFAPFFTAVSLYFLSLFEGKSPEEAFLTLKKLYLTVLLTNWKYLSLPVFINFNFVPPMLRVLVANLIGFFWIIYLSDKRRRAAAKKRE
jgi:peroxisomal membrane protein 2